MSLYTDLDHTHTPNDHADWQESFVLVFRDRKTNVCGFIRTGAYVNRGTAQVHWGMALPDGRRFRRNRARVPFDPSHRTTTTARTGDFTGYAVEGDHVRFWGKDPDAELDLRFYDFFPSQDWDSVGLDVPASLHGNHGHPESSGRVEGRVRIGDEVIEITDGVGHRDHGFGPRPHHIFRTARWHAGTVGPALSYSLVTMAGADGVIHKFGWMMREGRREKLKDFHTVNMTLSDGYSSIGGWTTVLLQSGERIKIEAETIDGIVTSSHEVNGGPGSSPAGIEAISIARWNGYEGVCDFNMIDNPHLGEQAVVGTLLANIDDGLSQRPFDPSWVR